MKVSLFCLCPCGIRVAVVVLDTEFVVHISLGSVEDPAWEIAPAEGSFDVFIFLPQ